MFSLVYLCFTLSHPLPMLSYLGTIIEIIDITDEGWWRGRYNGKEGMFPSNFVEMKDSTEELPKDSSPPDAGKKILLNVCMIFATL